MPQCAQHCQKGSRCALTGSCPQLRLLLLTLPQLTGHDSHTWGAPSSDAVPPAPLAWTHLLGLKKTNWRCRARGTFLDYMVLLASTHHH